MSGIKMLLMTAGGKRVQLPAAGIARSSIKIPPTDAAAGFRLHSDGTIDATPDNSTTLNYSEDLGPWLLSGAASDYEARISPGSPDAFSGQVENTWLGLGTTRDWYAQITGTGTQDCGLGGGPELLEIRDAVSFVVLASCNVSMYAEATP